MCSAHMMVGYKTRTLHYCISVNWWRWLFCSNPIAWVIFIYNIRIDVKILHHILPSRRNSFSVSLSLPLSESLSKLYTVETISSFIIISLFCIQDFFTRRKNNNKHIILCIENFLLNIAASNPFFPETDFFDFNYLRWDEFALTCADCSRKFRILLSLLLRVNKNVASEAVEASTRQFKRG